MFAYIMTLILLLPVMFLSAAVESYFSTEELTEMGIHLENIQPTDSPLKDIFVNS
jgi:hypothetical protein